MHVKEKIFFIVALLYILYTIFPLFADTFNIPIWLPSMATFVIMIVLYPQAFFNKVFYWFLVYGIILSIYLWLGRPLTIGIGTVDDNKKIIIEFAYILPTISIFSILDYLDDIKLTRRIVSWSIVILFVSFISAVPLMLQFNSIREALTEERGEEIIVKGLPSYSLMHAYTLFLPVLCYGAKVLREWGKWLSLIGVCVLCFVIYDTFVTTSLMVMIVTLILAMVYTDKSPSIFRITIIIILLLVYILYEFGFFIYLIDKINPVFEGTPVEEKLIDFKYSMNQRQLVGGTIVARQEYHEISWESFFSNPIWGSSEVGGHSTLIDRLGGMGLVAGLPYIMIFVSIIKKVFRYYSTKSARFFFGLGILVGIVYLYQKGMWASESWLMYIVLMPMGIRIFEWQSIKNSQEK